MNLNSLTPEEEQIIVNKGTEAPYSGKYENFNEEGIYACRRCDAYLYRSGDKFDAQCGWPSFDDAVLGAVRSSPDADGLRTEITCTRCGAHLGHVFLNENLTPKNARYCVNSISMKFVPQKESAPKEEAYFGGGCFWCTEAAFKMIKGVNSVLPGYAGGNSSADGEDPKYEEVSTGSTGHAEVVKVEFDPTVISYEAMLEVFFTVHDPTTLNRQGNDVGTQYRSVIFYKDDLQKELAEGFIKKLEAEKVFSNPIVTEVKPLLKFHKAEEYHQNYFAKNPSVGYCQVVIAPKMSKLVEHLKKYLK
jgi:peptide methionine sulfoxide reductase msrA/msrB